MFIKAGIAIATLLVLASKTVYGQLNVGNCITFHVAKGRYDWIWFRNLAGGRQGRAAVSMVLGRAVGFPRPYSMGRAWRPAGLAGIQVEPKTRYLG